MKNTRLLIAALTAELKKTYGEVLTAHGFYEGRQVDGCHIGRS